MTFTLNYVIRHIIWEVHKILSKSETLFTASTSLERTIRVQVSRFLFEAVPCDSDVS